MGRICTFIVVWFCLSCNSKEKELQIFIERNAGGDIISKAPYYLSSQGDTIVDGTVVHYYTNGKLEDSFKVSKGLKHGFYYQFDSSGALRSKLTFANNKREGFSWLYFSNGKREVEELFRGDSLLYSKNYYSNGWLKSYFIFIDKSRSGYFLLLDSLGKKVDEGGDSSKIKSW